MFIPTEIYRVMNMLPALAIKLLIAFAEKEMAAGVLAASILTATTEEEVVADPIIVFAILYAAYAAGVVVVETAAAKFIKYLNYYIWDG